MVLHPVIDSERASGHGRSPDARLEEAVGLAAAIALDVAHAQTARVSRIRPATLLGSGLVEQLKGLIAELDIGLVVMDHALSPIQQRNLEKAWDCKVIDRTGLILEIFGARARTAEGQLQVELAALSYQRSRLVRSWTHLERQRGGFGFLGGPGETQIETDRRLIDDRIHRIKKDLEHVRATRAQQRRARERVPWPVVALVGYTNAGKSTLFNRLTRARVFAADLLFATLDPTLRGLELPSGMKVMLSDTVGFISDLPTQLIAAFRATLEEVEGAEVILHVRDAAHPFSAAERADVLQVLGEIGIDGEADPRIIEVLNKSDLLPAGELAALEARADGRMAAVSAVTGAGLDGLLAAIDARVTAGRRTVTVTLGHGEGAARAWLHDRGEVMAEDSDEAAARLTVRLAPADINRFRLKFPAAGLDDPAGPGQGAEA